MPAVNIAKAKLFVSGVTSGQTCYNRGMLALFVLSSHGQKHEFSQLSNVSDHSGAEGLSCRVQEAAM